MYLGKLQFVNLFPHVSLLKNDHTCLTQKHLLLLLAAQQGKDPFSSH